MSKPIDPEHPAFLRVPVKCIPIVTEALRAAGFATEAAQVNDFTKMYTDPDLNVVREKWLEHAIATTQKDGEVEFDSDAIPSRTQDKGEYILGWVWVDEPEKE